MDEWYKIHRDDLVDGGFTKYSVGNYARRNDILVGMLSEQSFKTVVEVAGAEGDLTSKILARYDFIERYDWSDMVLEAIDIVKDRIDDPRLKVVQLDLDFESPPCADLFICTALEHTLKYREIIEELPKGTLVLMSLSNFDCFGHRIYFPQFTDVMDVYGDILKFFKVEIFISDPEVPVKDMVFVFIKKCLKGIGMLGWFRRIGLFKRSIELESHHFKWLFLARRVHQCDMCK